MKVLVCGGRRYLNRARVFEALDAVHAATPITKIISGKCKTGPDDDALLWAGCRGVSSQEYPAAWDDIKAPGAVIRYRDGKPYNVLAGFWRNSEMLNKEEPDILMHFPGETGTADMVTKGYQAINRGASLMMLEIHD